MIDLHLYYWWTGGMPRADKLSQSRKFDSYAIAAIAPVVALLPAWAVAVAAYWWVLIHISYTPYWLFASGVLLLGVLMFWRPTQRLVLQRLLGSRRPTPEERNTIQRAWIQVAQVNHINPAQFVIAVTDTDEINAFACGGHLMVVSSYAVQNLTHEQLTGVLAHELSHHLGLHTAALSVGQWLAVPIVLLAQIGFGLQNIADAATTSFARKSSAAEFVGRAIAGLLTIVSWAFLFMVTLSQYIANFVGKGAEFKADERVVEMGFGKQLSSALRVVIAQGDQQRPTRWQDRLVTSHPPARTRVARIDAQLRKLQRR
jgi:Zn-dependent protease with chaperone function